MVERRGIARNAPTTFAYTCSMRYLLVGNYGVGNLGDEMLKEYFLKAFPEVRWTVVSAYHSECGIVPRLPFGLRSFCTTPWWKTLSALRRSDGMVFGGGTLFTDTESVQAPLLWWWHALWAWIFRKKIILAFQGIGPFRTPLGEWCGRWSVEHAELTIVRDAESFRRISSWKNKKFVQNFDPVIRLFDGKKQVEEILRTQKLFIIIPRANATNAFFASVRDVYEKKQGECSGVRIISLEPGNAQEREICRVLSQKFHAPVAIPRSWKELQDALQGASFVLTQRYHGAVAALGMDIPFVTIPQMKGDKLASIAHIHRDEAIRQMKEGEAVLRHILSSSTYPL